MNEDRAKNIQKIIALLEDEVKQMSPNHDKQVRDLMVMGLSKIRQAYGYTMRGYLKSGG